MIISFKCPAGQSSTFSLLTSHGLMQSRANFLTKETAMDVDVVIQKGQPKQGKQGK